MNQRRIPLRRKSINARRRSGAAAVEAALVLPFLMMFLLGVMEYGRYVMMLHVLQNAAREGARYAIAHTEPVVISGVSYGNATSDVTNVVNNFLAGQTLSGQTVQVYLSDTSGNNIGTWTNAEAGDLICVRISGNFNFIVGSLLRTSSSLSVQVRSVMRNEAT
jgi:Flp pilus assembly protein TadG